jgi:3-methyl-2-oxobutanoate hydroxymethyltransferase
MTEQAKAMTASVSAQAKAATVPASAQWKAMTVPALTQKKAHGEKIAMVTAYDYPAGLLADEAGVEIVLVGDSLGREVLGYDSELSVTMDDMLHHLRAVRRAVRRALILSDMPFLTYQVNADEAVRNAGELMRAGANAVKIEGGVAIAPTIARMVNAGIPVMGHVGYQPQSVNVTGTRRQGTDEESAQRVLADAAAVQEAGAFGVVLELVPADLARRVSDALEIPTIGIGAGPHCDGQVLVFGDLIGLRRDRPVFKHVRRYMRAGDDILAALKAYADDVRAGRFPSQG